MRSIVVAGLALTLAGCGAEAKPAASGPEQEVQQTLVKVNAALRTRSAERVCAFYSASAKRDMVRDYGRRCEQTLKVALAGAPAFVLARKPKAGRVQIKGTHATVTEPGSAKDPHQIELIREGDAWKLYLDAPPSALEAAPECVNETAGAFDDVPAAQKLPAGTLDELIERLCARGSQVGLLPHLGSISDEDAQLLGISVINDFKREGKLTQEQAMALLRD